MVRYDSCLQTVFHIAHLHSGEQRWVPFKHALLKCCLSYMDVFFNQTVHYNWAGTLKSTTINFISLMSETVNLIELSEWKFSIQLTS